MTKTIVLFFLAFFLVNCNQNSDSKLELKAWHHSAEISQLSSTIYPFIKWNDVMKIKVGMTEKELGFNFQYYHHPINAIIFTKSPENIDYEVALKLTDDKKRITDLSFLKLKPKLLKE